MRAAVEFERKRRVLIISYHFPPLTRGGVFRPLKFAKYLPEFGWYPIVLCAEPTAEDVKDPALLEELPASAVVRRVGHLHPQRIEQHLLRIWSVLWKMRLRAVARRVEPYKLLRWMPPDPYVTWNRPAYREARKLIEEYEPSVIVTTSPPHSIQLLGPRLVRSARLPWVADFRDPWTRGFGVVFATRCHRQLIVHWERMVLEAADVVVANTDSQARQWRDLLQRCTNRKLVTITNGYDRSDFVDRDAEDRDTDKFRIVFAGTLYGEQNADAFLKATDRLVMSGDVPASSLRVDFMGTDGTGTLDSFASREWFSYETQQTHDHALLMMAQSSVLLDLVPAGAYYTLPTKLFEYIRTMRPILALAPLDSEVATILRATRTGIVVSPDDVDAIAAAVLTLFRAWRAGTLAITPDWAVINSFDRRRLTGQLAQVLNRLVCA